MKHLHRNQILLSPLIHQMRTKIFCKTGYTQVLKAFEWAEINIFQGNWRVGKQTRRDNVLILLGVTVGKVEGLVFRHYFSGVWWNVYSFRQQTKVQSLSKSSWIQQWVSFGLFTEICMRGLLKEQKQLNGSRTTKTHHSISDGMSKLEPETQCAASKQPKGRRVSLADDSVCWLSFRWLSMAGLSFF